MTPYGRIADVGSDQRRSNRDTTSTWEVWGNRSTSWHDDEVVAGLGEEPGVAAERGRVAAHQHDPAGVRWRRPGRPPWRRARCAAGRRRRRRRGAAPQWSTSARTIASVQAGEVHPGVGRRRRRLLDQRHRSVGRRACGRTARRRRRGRPGGPPAGRAPAIAPRTASTSASAPSGRAWKNERAEIRQRWPASSSWNHARRPADSSAAETTRTPSGTLDRSPARRRR